MATTLTSTEPPRKKIRKHVIAEEKSTTPAQRLFVPFRALGLVTNHIPLALQTRSFKGATDAPKTQVLTCLGKSWALWDGGKMTLLFVGTRQNAMCNLTCSMNVGPETKHQILCLLMDGDAVWASSGSNLTKFIRGKEVGSRISPRRLSSTVLGPTTEQSIRHTLVLYPCVRPPNSGIG